MGMGMDMGGKRERDNRYNGLGLAFTFNFNCFVWLCVAVHSMALHIAIDIFFIMEFNMRYAIQDLSFVTFSMIANA
jgi:hypothetical protein